MTGKVKQLEGLAAVFSEDRGLSDDFVGQATVSKVDSAELESLARAGWVIAAETPLRPEQRRVYKDDAGHVLIEGQYLTLQTNPGVTAEEFEGLVRDHRLAIRRTLGLRRNRYQVSPAERGSARPDLLEICAKLEQDGRVKWAEPSFIEVIGQRNVTQKD